MSKAPRLVLSNNKPIQGVLVDISGTLHIGDQATPGAIDACRKLFNYNKDQRNLKVLFLTNTSKVSSKTLLHQLREMGFDKSCISNQDAIVTSINATRQYLLTNGLRPYCLVEDDLIEKDFQGIEMDDPNCVLVGLAPSKFCYEKLNGAFRLLSKLKEQNEHASGGGKPSLIAIHRAEYYRDSDHQLSLGPGGFITLLEQSAGVTAHVVGKPSHLFYHAAVSSLGLDPANVVMVGDDVLGDVKGALDAGLGGAVLVKTGKYVDGDELGNKTDGVEPTLTLPSFADAVDCICSSIG